MLRMHNTISDSKDWEPYVEEICNLYSDRGLGLNEVRQHMIDHRNLKATFVNAPSTY